MVDINQLNEQIKKESQFIGKILTEVGHVVVGQKHMLERILMGFLTEGHILLEGVPGLAKTLTIRSIADSIDLNFQRIQFTPDLLPSDLIGTMIFNQKTGEFAVKKGPIFTNIVLADEINRAPAKVQSALLEAMAEKQVTIGDETHKLQDPFLVLATQNPLEQEGTYPLPEAQMDRFMFKVLVTYPTKDDEMEILSRMTAFDMPSVSKVIGALELKRARQLVTNIYIDDKVKQYIVDIVMASRQPKEFGLDSISNLLQVGGSPRATINLTKSAKAHAFIKGRGFVTPEDVKAIAYDVLRHRLILTYEAEAEEIKSDAVIREILNKIEVP
ncbi:MAG: MoxR family ATPase [Oligoflexia bacterium]|nr:MoxR family ATPase [Oligoflexia bacterium]